MYLGNILNSYSRSGNLNLSFECKLNSDGLSPVRPEFSNDKLRFGLKVVILPLTPLLIRYLKFNNFCSDESKRMKFDDRPSIITILIFLGITS